MRENNQNPVVEKVSGKQGYKVLCIHEPGGTHVGEVVRKLLLDDANAELFKETELLLFSADRARLVREVIEPALRSGEADVVLCDRSFYSTLACHGYSRKLSVETLKKMSEFAVGKTQSDLVLFLEIDPTVGVFRKETQGEINRIYKESLGFYIEVWYGYITLAENDLSIWMIIDTSLSVDEVHNQVTKVVMEKLRREWRFKKLLTKFLRYSRQLFFFNIKRTKNFQKIIKNTSKNAKNKEY